MEYIDIVYYINLDKREDRNKHMKEILQDLNVPYEKIHRISAVLNTQKGSIGASESHLNTVKKFIESGNNTCIIMEDDFTYEDKNTFWKYIEQVFQSNIDFDIIQLSYNHRQLIAEDTQYSFLKKVLNGQTASGYILSKHFAPKLLENLECGLNLLKKSFYEKNVYDYTYTYPLDSYWKIIQPNSKWFCFVPRLGYQMPSYSDIENTFVDYKV